jgi:hypothetical protein
MADAPKLTEVTDRHPGDMINGVYGLAEQRRTDLTIGPATFDDYDFAVMFETTLTDIRGAQVTLAPEGWAQATALAQGHNRQDRTYVEVFVPGANDPLNALNAAEFYIVVQARRKARANDQRTVVRTLVKTKLPVVAAP